MGVCGGGEGCGGMQVGVGSGGLGGGKGLVWFVACHYTYHSFLEMTEPSV